MKPTPGTSPSSTGTSVTGPASTGALAPFDPHPTIAPKRNPNAAASRMRLIREPDHAPRPLSIHAILLTLRAPVPFPNPCEADYGSVIRPGAPLVPFWVWHELQSPLVCATGMIRSRPW